MTKTLPNGDVITTETIADKIRRVAKHPQVVKNRRLLKTMHYITTKEDAVMTFTNELIAINGGTRKVIAVVAQAEVDNNGMWYDKLGEKITMFPLNAYDPHTGEPPTICG